MTTTAATVQDYLASLSEERRPAMEKLRDVIRKNLPKGFAESMTSTGICFVVPHAKYPAGYHCDPKQPLPFVAIASQKNFIALYHMGLYGMPDLLGWFTEEYHGHSKTKLDMGKGCVRFKKPDAIPFALIGELMKKVTPEKWIECYERTMKR